MNETMNGHSVSLTLACVPCPNEKQIDWVLVEQKIKKKRFRFLQTWFTCWNERDAMFLFVFLIQLDSRSSRFVFLRKTNIIQELGWAHRFWRIPSDGQGLSAYFLPRFSAAGLPAEAFLRWAKGSQQNTEINNTTINPPPPSPISYPPCMYAYRSILFKNRRAERNMKTSPYFWFTTPMLWFYSRVWAARSRASRATGSGRILD